MVNSKLENPAEVTFFMKNKRIIYILIAVLLLLMVPLIAMQYTNEVVWTFSDFVFAFVVLFGSGLSYELISRKAGNIAYKGAVAIAIAAGLLLIWINGAVGIIGNEDNPANLMYMGVLFVGLIGTIIARLNPQGMSGVLFIMAVLQFLVPVIALITSQNAMRLEPPGVIGVFILNSFFVVMFIASALLFKRSTVKN